MQPISLVVDYKLNNNFKVDHDVKAHHDAKVDHDVREKKFYIRRNLNNLKENTYLIKLNITHLLI